MSPDRGRSAKALAERLRRKGRHLALPAFRQPGKTALRFDPFGLVAAVRVDPTSLRSTIGSRVHPLPGVTFDQTAAKRPAPRRFSRIMTV
jgi:hypothetical protein